MPPPASPDEPAERHPGKAVRHAPDVGPTRSIRATPTSRGARHSLALFQHPPVYLNVGRSSAPAIPSRLAPMLRGSRPQVALCAAMRSEHKVVDAQLLCASRAGLCWELSSHHDMGRMAILPAGGYCPCRNDRRRTRPRPRLHLLALRRRNRARHRRAGRRTRIAASRGACCERISIVTASAL